MRFDVDLSVMWALGCVDGDGHGGAQLASEKAPK